MTDDLFRSLKSIADRVLVLSSQDEELRRLVRQLANVLLAATQADSPEPSQPATPPVPLAADNLAVPGLFPCSSEHAPLPPERVVSTMEALVLKADAVKQEAVMQSAEAGEPEASAVVVANAGTGGGESSVRLAMETSCSLGGRQPLPELTLGRSSPAAMPMQVRNAVAANSVTEDDFDWTESRCRLKAEGARWAAKRRRLLSEGANFAMAIDPMDKDIIARAKAIPDCFLWMCYPSGPSPADLNKFEVVAGCFDGLAGIVALVGRILQHRETLDGLHSGRFWEDTLRLLAEAQSAVRVAIANIGGPKDHDQLHVFEWLKRTCSESHIYIDKYMRVDDPDDPSQWRELATRIEAHAAVFQETKRRIKARRKLLGKIRHKVSQVSQLPESAEDEAVNQWRQIAHVIEELLGEGMPPSDRELRELLLPAIDGMPDLQEIPNGLRLVLREIDRVVASSPAPVERANRTPTPELIEAARLLNGRSMVLIGGTRRPDSHQALVEALGLKELDWIEPREHQSIDSFEPHVSQNDVAVVLLAIRWSSHSFSDVLAFCDRHGKLLVRLPTGYNPNQVASQIMGQCSERLRQA